MKNENLTELVFILDRSGSMTYLEEDTIGGYNSLLKKQRKEEGAAVITTVLFDDKYEMIHDHVDISIVRDLTEKEYYARGGTALFDAIGKTINHVGYRHKFANEWEVPGKTLIVIITDGYENASREFDLTRIRNMISNQQNRFGWEFLFLGANIDAVKTASSFGIRRERAVTFYADSGSQTRNFEAVSIAASSIRKECSIDESWKKNIEDYMKHRKDNDIKK